MMGLQGVEAMNEAQETFFMEAEDAYLNALYKKQAELKEAEEAHLREQGQ